MALLQISEPGSSLDPHQRRHVVGIDLGTTHSLVAAVRHGVPECLPDANGRVLLPSAVRYLPGGRTEVGDAALAHRVDDPHNTLVSVKRLMGRSRADLDPASTAAFSFAGADDAAAGDDGRGMVRLATVAGARSPVEVSAEILAVLRYRAEDTLDAELDGAVVTVPAYFDDAQRQATKDAARLAGLEVLRLVSEPTAAAIAYGLERGSEGLYAVYDLGGGTFDVSLLRLTRGVFEVVATGGDTALGGDDIDAALATWLLQRAGRTVDSAGDRRAVVVAARAVKEALSSADEATARFTVAGESLAITVTRADLEGIATPLIERTLAVGRRVLRDAGVETAEVQGVVMVGGATRMPLVRARVAAWFGREPLVDHDPDQVVALGAALQAEALSGNPSSGAAVLLLDVTALSLGIETMGGLVERVIPRNTPIPTARAQTFTTFQDGQRAMAIHVVQGEREMVADCRSLARFELRGIPAMAAGAARIEVTFTVDADGLLSVSAREETTGIEAAVTVKPSYGLAEGDIARMLQEGYGAAEADAAARALRESQVEADRLVTATRAALGVDADLLDAAERRRIDAALDRVCTACTAHDRPAIEAAARDLAAVTEPFAAARMNRGIARALAGRKVDEV